MTSKKFLQIQDEAVNPRSLYDGGVYGGGNRILTFHILLSLAIMQCSTSE